VVATPSLIARSRRYRAPGSTCAASARPAPNRHSSQASFKLGDVVLEVAATGTDASGPARFWGLVVVVADLGAVVASAGGLVGTPRDAVQPGRRIATVRRESRGVDPMAFMTPDPRRVGLPRRAESVRNPA